MEWPFCHSQAFVVARVSSSNRIKQLIVLLSKSGMKLRPLQLFYCLTLSKDSFAHCVSLITRVSVLCMCISCSQMDVPSGNKYSDRNSAFEVLRIFVAVLPLGFNRQLWKGYFMSGSEDCDSVCITWEYSAATSFRISFFLSINPINGEYTYKCTCTMYDNIWHPKTHSFAI